MATIVRTADVNVVPANPEYFTGTVFQSALSAAGEPSGVQVLRVTFAPGARTTWHTHPNGQVLHIENGVCLFQSWGEDGKRLYPGDTITISPGEKHWHGASSGTVMIHVAIHTLKDGKPVHWLEAVTEQQYGAISKDGA